VSLNRWVFKWNLKVRMLSHSRMSAGTEFQVDGAAAEKERRASSVCMRGTTSSGASDDLISCLCHQHGPSGQTTRHTQLKHDSLCVHTLLWRHKNAQKTSNNIHLAWEKPEEHVAVQRFIDGEKACITRYRSAVQAANCCQLSSYKHTHHN